MSGHDKLKTIHFFTQLYRCCWTSCLTSHICIHIRIMSLFTQLYRCCWTSLLTSHICIHIRIMGLLTQLFDIPPLSVENNKIFTQMPTTTTTTTPPPKHHRHTFVGEPKLRQKPWFSTTAEIAEACFMSDVTYCICYIVTEAYCLFLFELFSPSTRSSTVRGVL